jgi:predicted RNA-binding protein with PUA-like domain
MAKHYWIMKSEPSEFSLEDLQKQGSSVWDGVRNYQVRNMFRDVMQAGDMALMYYSNTDMIGVVGEMLIVEPAVVDDTQFKVGHKYYDSKSTRDNPRWLGPRVSYVSAFPRTVTLAEMRADERFADVAFVQKGNRLSVTEVTKDQYQLLKNMAKR